MSETVDGLLDAAREAGLDRLDAQLLLGAVLDRPRARLLAHGDAPVAGAERCRALIARRAAGEPLAYLLGEKEFHGLRLEVGPAVLGERLVGLSRVSVRTLLLRAMGEHERLTGVC